MAAVAQSIKLSKYSNTECMIYIVIQNKKDYKWLSTNGAKNKMKKEQIAKWGAFRDSNPGPLAPKARIIATRPNTRLRGSTYFGLSNTMFCSHIFERYLTYRFGGRLLYLDIVISNCPRIKILIRFSQSEDRYNKEFLDSKFN